MSRFYTVSTGEQPVTAAQDLLEVVADSQHCLLVHEVVITQQNITADQMLRVQVRRVSGAFTSGSGGGSATVTKARSLGDSASSFTAERNNTTVISGGTQEVLAQRNFYLMQGFQYRPVVPIEIQPTDAIVVTIEAPAGSTDITGEVLVEEIG